jgi:peptidoglycan-associated lipoprotein
MSMKKNLLLSVLMVSFLAACASHDVKEQPKAAVEGRTAAAAAPAAATQPAVQSATSGNPLKDPNNILSKRSVYFDYDKDVVKEEFKPLVEAHAKYLQAHGDVKVTLQGNTDERGSREYNIALGQRRADAVKKAMNVLGVADKQIETVSFGEEKPRKECHEESCWQENRRADVVYQGE